MRRTNSQLNLSKVRRTEIDEAVPVFSLEVTAAATRRLERGRTISGEGHRKPLAKVGNKSSIKRMPKIYIRNEKEIRPGSVVRLTHYKQGSYYGKEETRRQEHHRSSKEVNNEQVVKNTKITSS